MIVLDILSWILLLGGAFFSVTGGIGVVRLPDFFSRLHGGGITDTMGAGMILLGLVVQAIRMLDGIGSLLVVTKLVIILFFLLVTSPTSCHALAKSALIQGMQPELDGQSPSESDEQA